MKKEEKREGRTIERWERWNDGTKERWNDGTIILRFRQGYGGQKMSMPVRREETDFMVSQNAIPSKN